MSKILDNVYILYLTVMIYILIIVLFTDQELLFREGDKQLPFFGISVPIVGFFTWMPWALLVLHFYLLTQVMFLSDMVRLSRQAIKNQSEEDTRKAKMLLEPVSLVRIFVEGKANFKHKMLYLIVFVSLAVFPLIVLIVTQIAFLPYQNEEITWSHRIVILIDLSMLWYFGCHILGSHEGKTIWINSIAGLLVVLILVFVVIVVFIDFPGSKIYGPVTASFYELETVNEIMPNRFILPDRELVELPPAPDLLAAHIKEQTDDKTLIESGSPIWCRYAESLDLKNRNFRKAHLQKAILCGAILPEAKLTKVDLKNAVLISADLSNADLRDGDLRGADLRNANLRGTDLRNADLRGTDLRNADLSNADLMSATFISAVRGRMAITGVDFREADLREANLTATNLSRIDFSDAVLGETILYLTWVWESSIAKKKYFPIGIPEGWNDTLKPEYLCPRGFYVSDYIDISEYINKDSEVEQKKKEQLNERLKQIMEKHCKPYNP